MLIGADEELLSIARRYMNILAPLLIRKKTSKSTDANDPQTPQRLIQSILALGTDKRLFGAIG